MNKKRTTPLVKYYTLDLTDKQFVIMNNRQGTPAKTNALSLNDIFIKYAHKIKGNKRIFVFDKLTKRQCEKIVALLPKIYAR